MRKESRISSKKSVKYRQSQHQFRRNVSGSFGDKSWEVAEVSCQLWLYIKHFPQKLTLISIQL